jgi:transcriptional regulator with XRE-family HTH domain
MNDSEKKARIAATVATRKAKRPEVDARAIRISQAIRDRIAAIHMSQKEFAEVVGTSPQYMNKLLKGATDPSFSTMFPKMVEAMNLSPLETHEMLTGEKVGNIKHIPSIRKGDPLLDLNTGQIVCGLYPKGAKPDDLNRPAPISTLLPLARELIEADPSDHIIAVRDMRRHRSKYLGTRDVVYVNHRKQPEAASTYLYPVYILANIEDELHIAEVMELSARRMTVQVLPDADPQKIDRKQCLGIVVARLKLG